MNEVEVLDEHVEINLKISYLFLLICALYNNLSAKDRTVFQED